MCIDPDLVSFQVDYDYFGLRFCFLGSFYKEHIEYQLEDWVQTYCFDDQDNEYIHDGFDLKIEIFKDEFINKMLEDFLKEQLNEPQNKKGKCNFIQKSVTLWE